MSGANSNIQLTGLDFDDIKNNLKLFLKSQDVLKDANYEGSVLSTLLDILAYNTHYQAYYLNMMANEMFLDTSTKRTSVISHAKLLGYTPQSYIPSSAKINLVFNNVKTDFITIPKYTKFMSSVVNGQTYNFITNEEITVKSNNSTKSATANDVIIIQGVPIAHQFLYSSTNNPKSIFKIPDPTVDTSTIKVLVQNSTTDVRLEVYSPPKDLLALDSNSLVYFIQESLDGYYEIYFGDGYLGKKLNDGNIVYITYISSSENISVDISSFALVDDLGDYSSYNIDIVESSRSGSVKQSIDSIKWLAPKVYSAQERAVTLNDYIALITKNSQQFPIDSVNVWSGESNVPPIYGKIFISLKPKGGYSLTISQKNYIKENIIKPISVVTIEPIIVDPEYTYVRLDISAIYNKNKTLTSLNQLQDFIKSTVSDFSSNTLNTFYSTLAISELSERINNIDDSIIANEIDVVLEKRIIPALGTSNKYTIDFGVAIKRDVLRKSVSVSPTFKVIDNFNSVLRNEVFVEETPSSGSSIISIQVMSQGFNYTSVPTVTIVGDGSGATAVAEILNGQISKINVTNKGSGYTQAAVQISGGGGLNAYALPTIDSQIGLLRSFYYLDGNKIILDSNFGVVDYLNGIITLNSFNPEEINNSLSILSINVVPDTTLIKSINNRIITIDPYDYTAVKVTLSQQ
jgi:hypothetical protein